MVSDKRGTKRQCLHCGMKYYDLNRDPILCPGCKTPYVDPAEAVAEQAKAQDVSEDAAVVDGAADSVEIDPGAKIAGADVVSFDDAEVVVQVDGSDEDIPDVDGVEDIGGEVDNVFVESDDDDDAKIDFGVTAAKDDE